MFFFWTTGPREKRSTTDRSSAIHESEASPILRSVHFLQDIHINTSSPITRSPDQLSYRCSVKPGELQRRQRPAQIPCDWLTTVAVGGDYWPLHETDQYCLSSTSHYDTANNRANNRCKTTEPGQLHCVIDRQIHFGRNSAGRVTSFSTNMIL